MQFTWQLPWQVISHDCTPLHRTTERSPTVPLQLGMFEHVSWQLSPHVGAQALAPLQSMLHDEPHAPLHVSPFWHCTLQLLAGLPLRQLNGTTDDVDELETDVDDDVLDVVADVEPVDGPTLAVETVALSLALELDEPPLLVAAIDVVDVAYVVSVVDDVVDGSGAVGATLASLSG